MSFGQFFAILRARRWVVLGVLGVTLLLTLAVSLVLPKQYEAMASVVVDFKPDPVSAAVYGGMPSPAVVATQVDIINSERVALRVIRNLRLAESPQVRQQWMDDTDGVGTIEQWLVGLFQKRLTVEPSRDSSVIRVTFTGQDPQFAAALANAFVRAYTDTALELRVNPARQYSGFFDQQVKGLREAMEAAQTRLSEYQKTNGLIATDERLDIETARLNELSSQLVAIQAITAESRSRLAQAQSGSGAQLQEVMNNPQLAAIQADITRTEVRLQEMGARLGDRHPQVLEARANLEALRSRLAEETKRVMGGVGVSNTVNAQREAQLRASLTEQREKLLRLKAVRDEGMVLQRDMEHSQRAYDAVQARLSQTNLESQTTQSNVSPLSQATVPVAPSSPQVLLNMVLAAFLGLLLALGIALLLELMDRRLRTVDDVAPTLDLPLIGVMPKPGSRRAKQSLLHQRLLAPQTPAIAKGA